MANAGRIGTAPRRGARWARAAAASVLVMTGYGCSESTSPTAAAYFSEVDRLPALYTHADGFLLAPMERYLERDLATAFWNHHFFDVSFTVLGIHEEGWANGVNKAKVESDRAGHRGGLAMSLEFRGHVICLLEQKHIDHLSTYLTDLASVTTWEFPLFAAWHEYAHCEQRALQPARHETSDLDEAFVYEREVFADLYALMQIQRLSQIDGRDEVLRYRDRNLRESNNISHWTRPLLTRWYEAVEQGAVSMDEEALLNWLADQDVLAIRDRALQESGA